MLNQLYQNSKIAARALSFVITALLALALAVGANSGILSLSEFTHARGTVFPAEHELIRGTGSETFPDSANRQVQSEQSEQTRDFAPERFEIKLGKSLFNRRVLTGRF